GLDVVVLCAAEGSDVDDHVDFACTVGEGSAGFEELALGRGAPGRGAHNRPDGNIGAGEQARCQCDIGRLDANRKSAVAGGERATVADVVLGQFGTQKGVIDE